MDLLDIRLSDEAATRAFGARLARTLASGDVVALSGPLGAGKTTLARGVIAALADDAQAPSPTFALVETYRTPNFLLWHFDLYRLERAEDVYELGFEDALAEGVALIEWAERIEWLLPAGALLIRLDADGRGRRIRLLGEAVWSARLKQAGFARERID